MIVVNYITQQGCAPCITYKPLIQEVASQFGVQFLEINAADQNNSDFLNGNSVTSTPTVIIINDGQNVAQYNGGPGLDVALAGDLESVLVDLGQSGPVVDPPVVDPRPGGEDPITFADSFGGLKTLKYLLLAAGAWLILKK